MSPLLLSIKLGTAPWWVKFDVNFSARVQQRHYYLYHDVTEHVMTSFSESKNASRTIIYDSIH